VHIPAPPYKTPAVVLRYFNYMLRRCGVKAFHATIVKNMPSAPLIQESLSQGGHAIKRLTAHFSLPHPPQSFRWLR
jgi:hypothetical protein